MISPTSAVTLFFVGRRDFLRGQEAQEERDTEKERGINIEWEDKTHRRKYKDKESWMEKKNHCTR